MRRHVLLIAVLASSSLLACGSSSPSSTNPPDEASPTVATTGAARAEPPAAAAPEVPTATAGESKAGIVKYEQLPRTKSLRAYTGEELFLEMEGERITLRPTAAVDRDRLLGLAGRRVQLRVAWTGGHPPAEGLSAPLGPDGRPLAQGAGWRVLAVEKEL
ncbi:MAG: hypothetical protein EP329_20540 [Deltaproteobacteria bacterium]|nr:MAG: hypothetical protein EP329_20540 [Deltaproteobacteria bacterium]